MAQAMALNGMDHRIFDLLICALREASRSALLCTAKVTFLMTAPATAL